MALTSDFSKNEMIIKDDIIDLENNLFYTKFSKNYDSFVELYLMLLKNNTIVGLIICIGGYFSAGIIAVVCLVWNSYLLGLIIQSTLAIGIPLEKVLISFSTYGIIELFALLWLSVLGLQGSLVLKDLVWSKKFNFKYVPSIFECVTPFIFITIAAFIETVLIRYYGR